MNKIKWFSIIRIVGLLLILGYHLFSNQLPAGFLGVDIFFVVSGYLITASIINEIATKGRFGLLSFYHRRILRIIPPLLLAIVFTLPFALLISSDNTVGIGKQLAAAGGFVSNWFEIISGGSYENALFPHLYVHTWFLAVEMQFYLIWGLVCAGVAGLFRHSRNLKVVFCAICVFLAACSYGFMQYLFHDHQDFSAIYFNTFARLCPFLIGAAVAVMWGAVDETKITSKKRPLKIVLLVAASALIMATIVYIAINFDFNSDFVYQKGFLLVSVMAAALLVLMRELHKVTKCKEPRVLTATADLSYNVYLVHWPLYIILSGIILNNIVASSATLVITFVFAVLMFYEIEPALHQEGPRRRRLRATLVMTLLFVAVASSTVVICRAPVSTSVEKDFVAGYVENGVAEIYSVKTTIDSANSDPVIYKTKDGVLQIDVLPEVTNRASSFSSASIYREPVRISGGVTIIGDSVALGAQTTLSSSIPNSHVDAKVSRSISAGYDAVMDFQSRGELREFVVIAFGTNGSYSYASLMTKIIKNMEPGHKIVFVTPFDGRDNKNSGILNETAEWERGLPAKYNYVTIADWNRLISGQAGTLAGDKVHMGGQTSRLLYTNCIIEALNIADKKPAK